MESIVRAIESEINVTESRLSALRKSLDSLRRITTTETAHVEGPEKFDGRYRGQKARAAILQFMQIRRSASKEEIRQALDRGGMSWGKYPKRQVALAIANRPDIYTLRGNIVTLIPNL